MHHAYAKHWFNCFDISTFSASSVSILLTNSCTVSPDTTLSCKKYFQKVTAIDLLNHLQDTIYPKNKIRKATSTSDDAFEVNPRNPHVSVCLLTSIIHPIYLQPK